MKYVIGIDEAGRGPLAGPVAVGAVSVAYPERSRGVLKGFFKGIKDSKKLSSEERELWFDLTKEAERQGDLRFSVSLISETVIDRKGIVPAIQLGIRRCLRKLAADERETQIFLDGALVAPKQFIHQKTVIRGDEKIPLISLASIMAKVIRDRRMIQMSKKFPEFGFERHKGYGTSLHLSALRQFGPTIIHRRTFLKPNLLSR